MICVLGMVMQRAGNPFNCKHFIVYLRLWKLGKTFEENGKRGVGSAISNLTYTKNGFKQKAPHRFEAIAYLKENGSNKERLSCRTNALAAIKERTHRFFELHIILQDKLQMVISSGLPLQRNKISLKLDEPAITDRAGKEYTKENEAGDLSVREQIPSVVCC